ncbi:DUF6318 family protein [Cellulomonas fimi]|nr:DUF6318 family protein [Cellulomonas fimi]
MRVRGWKVVAGLVVGAMMFAGCTAASDASPPPTPTSTRGSSPEPSPSPTPSEPTVAKPERPAEMDRTDEVGAAAAAEYFLSLYAYVMQTGDFAEWDAMSTELCGFCAKTRASAEELAAMGSRYHGGEIKVDETTVGAFDELFSAYPVRTVVTQSDARTVSGTGQTEAENPGRRGDVLVEVTTRPQGWGVLSVVSEAR